MKEFGGYEVPGPGEVLSELSLGLNIQVLEGKISLPEAQEYFNAQQRWINILALAYPECPWDTGSTQVKELGIKRKELLAARNNGAKLKLTA